MKRALITGVSGQDGSYLAEMLLADGYEVSGLIQTPDDMRSPNLAAVADRLSFVAGELAEPGTLRGAIEQVAPSEIYHLAAPTSVAQSWKDPDGVRRLIADATSVVLEAAATLNEPARVFAAASSEIFGNSGESPQNEASPKRPTSPYGEAKLAAFELVASARERGLFAVAGIFYNHESPRRPPHFLPRKVTRGAAAIALGEQDKLELGDLDAVRDWSHASDIMRGARLALTAELPDDYVFASGAGRTVGELVDVAFAAAGVDPQGRIEINPEFVRPREATPLIGDASHARSELGWEPQISFEEMIGEMVAADLAER